MNAELSFGVLAAMGAGSVMVLRPLHPAQLWLLPWAAATGLYVLWLLPYREMASRTAWLIAGAAIAFSAGTLLGDRLARRIHGVPVGARRLDERTAVTAAWIAGLIALALIALFVVQVSSRFGLGAAVVPSAEVRDAIGAGAFNISIKYVYAALSAAALFAYAAGCSESGRRRWLGLAFLAAVSTFWSTGRATVLSALIVLCAVYIGAGGMTVSRRRFIVGVGVGGVLAMTLLLAGGEVIGKTYENNVALRGVPSYFETNRASRPFALPYQYASAPIASFDVLVRNAPAWPSTSGCAVFTTVCAALKGVGAPVEPVGAVRPFTAPPLPWNTYTALDLPVLDVGLVLLIPSILVLGGAVGACWGLANDGLWLAVLLYGALAAAIVSSSGSFNFLASHLIGSVVIAAACVFAARLLQREPGRASA